MQISHASARRYCAWSFFRRSGSDSIQSHLALLLPHELCCQWQWNKRKDPEDKPHIYLAFKLLWYIGCFVKAQKCTHCKLFSEGKDVSGWDRCILELHPVSCFKVVAVLYMIKCCPLYVYILWVLCFKACCLKGVKALYKGGIIQVRKIGSG